MHPKHITAHLEHLTPQNLLNFRLTAFCSLATSNGKGGNFSLGVDAFGNFVCKKRLPEETVTFYYDTPEEAIAKYTELLTV